MELDPNFAHLVAHDIFYAVGVSYDRLDQLSTSTDYLEKSLEAFDLEKGQTAIWQIYFELAQSLRRVFASKQVKYFDPNNWIEWIDHYLKVIDLLESDVEKSKSLFIFRKKVKLSQKKADVLLTACHYVGIFYFYTGKFQEAIRYCSQGINGGGQTQPDLSVTYLLLGASYLREGDTQKGRRIYEKLLEIDPDHQWAKNVLDVYRELGQIYRKEKRYEKSLTYLLKGLELENLSSNQVADLHLGIAYDYYDLNSYKNAVQHFREFFRLSDPKTPERKTAMEYLVNANGWVARQK